jgi:CBS domain-containing protein
VSRREPGLRLERAERPLALGALDRYGHEPALAISGENQRDAEAAECALSVVEEEPCSRLSRGLDGVVHGRLPSSLGIESAEESTLPGEKRPMRVREVMTSPAMTLHPDATLADAAASMVERRTGSVVVVDPADSGRVVGIVTETDLEIRDERVPHSYPLTRAPRLLDRWVQSSEQFEQALASAGTRPVAGAMSAPVWTIEAGAEIWKAARLMLEHDVKRLPVTERGRLVGVVARHDLLKAMVALSRENG